MLLVGVALVTASFTMPARAVSPACSVGAAVATAADAGSAATTCSFEVFVFGSVIVRGHVEGLGVVGMKIEASYASDSCGPLAPSCETVIAPTVDSGTLLHVVCSWTGLVAVNMHMTCDAEA
jgi:hypothetical protein